MKQTTGEQLRDMQKAFADPLLARIKVLEARNAELVDALQSCLDYGSMTGAEWVEDKARAALATYKGE